MIYKQWKVGVKSDPKAQRFWILIRGRSFMLSEFEIHQYRNHLEEYVRAMAFSYPMQFYEFVHILDTYGFEKFLICS